MIEPQINILVVDDDDVTVEIVERSLKKVSDRFKVFGALDGLAALQILRGDGVPQISKPYMILLDLNMPRMNGFEFLETIRADEKLAHAVVFVLTTSDNDNDRTRAYHENIAGYMVKSAVGAQFTRLTSMLCEYSSAVRLPM